jgi:hypothetical protein
VLADHKIELVVFGQQADRAARINAFLGAFGVLVSVCPMVEIAHQINYFAGHSLFAGGPRQR